jgi:glycosyltransferase involved in cell wall biosynthesis
MSDKFRIGIISGKMGDVDGVSLEINKWIQILTEFGHTVFTIAGQYRNGVVTIPLEKQFTLEKIRFDSKEQKYYERYAFPHLNEHPAKVNDVNKKDIIDSITSAGNDVAHDLYDYIKDYNMDLIIAQNTNAMPMTLLGGMGIYMLSTERRVATIFHHHDFWWERSRFSNNNIEQLLTRIMPPADLGVEHIVLSSYAAHILRSLKRVNPEIIPNCENFDQPVTVDEYNSDFREEFGFTKKDFLIVQPTRIVRRKRLEDSLELVSHLVRKYPDLKNRIHFIVSLYQGDEPDRNYIEDVTRTADRKGVPLHLIADRISSVRGLNESGKKMYTNRDVLAHADIATYLPIWEGFGNAMIEAIAAKVPIVTTTYLVYKTDIMGIGLNNIEIRGNYDQEGRLVISDQTLEEMYFILTHASEKKDIVDRNFDIARRHFGFDTLRRKLSGVIANYSDEIKASRKRLKKSKMSYSV